MIGKFLYGMLSGVVLVALAFVLGSALFPVEASRSSGAAKPGGAEDQPLESAGAGAGAEADAGVASQPAEDDTATQEATTADPTVPASDSAAAPAPTEPEPQADASGQTTAPAVDAATDAVVEPPGKVAAENAASGVTEAVDGPGDSPAEASADATLAVEAEPPSAEPSPATKPDPQVAAAAPAPDPAAIPATAPEIAPADPAAGAASAADPEVAAEFPSTVEPAAQPAVPDLARLDAGAVLAALDKAAVDQSPPAPIETPAVGQSDPDLAAEPATQTPVTIAPDAQVPGADTPVADAEPPAAETAPAPDALAEADETTPETLPDSNDPGMPGTQPDALPLQDEPVPEPEVVALPEAGDGVGDGVGESTLKPTARLGDSNEGVVIGRLPRIGAEGTDDTLVTEGLDPAPEAEPLPIVRFAATFENPDGKPTAAIVLIDPGTADLDRVGLASLPFPVSFALDPLDPATPDRAALYRAAGKEVVMLATGIAEGAQASDIEVAFQSMAQGLPEAVAVMDLAEPTFQNRRLLASFVVPVVGAQGRGLLTWDAGLNAADQVARREDIPAAVVFRDLTSGGTDGAAIRRVLDRAIFKAAQDGRVVVAGTASPETVAALLEWSVEGKAATVALAPLTGVMAVD